MTLRLGPEAQLELEETMDLYEQARPGLGLDFLREVERVSARIEAGPHRFPTIDGSLQRALCKRFPFMLVFEVLDADIRVLAIAHQRRERGYWRSRSSS